ncbi:MAG: molybdopterin-synthase adenylyltransferase MoeB [Burkholderiaceae bacterium]|nr:molybdopterin-synthase adenylyltransferase MoeB [Burkholderiaceae bacterium]MCD8517414.1 molybdopterin-synthase adenylyltransferase MoeB [Burkholderiaceae bacterium]MCD8564972.1 molybdopterin-synthase adenylyltransferase MoeB [Burkholderiaceae bacterium]
MRDDELLRYGRHILLDDIGIEGQQALLASKVLVIGAGGLGSPVCLYLASAGVGEIRVADDDTVELSNLQRQIMHSNDRLGSLKVNSAQHAIAQLNPDTRVVPLPVRLDGDALLEQISAVDLVLDCCDNFQTRHAVNRACVQAGKPLVSGAAIRFEGQVCVYDTRDPASPCYHCLFPEAEDVTPVNCATMGVFAPLVGIIGSLQAAEAIKLLASIGKPLKGRLVMFDARLTHWHEVRVPRDPNCPVCGVRGSCARG